MIDTSVEALVPCVSDLNFLETGLAFDRFDVLVVAGDDVAIPSGQRADAFFDQSFGLADIIKALLPACPGPELIDALAPWAAQVKEIIPPERLVEAAGSERIARTACALLNGADA